MTDLIGKKVTFNFGTLPIITGIVKYVPKVAGDVFIVVENNVEYRIQNFNWMRVHGKSDE